MLREKKFSLQERPKYIIPAAKQATRDDSSIGWSSHDYSLKTRLLSPAVPGYTGFVPAQKTSGLGLSYGTRTKRNLSDFWRQRNDKMQLARTFENGNCTVKEGTLLPPIPCAKDVEREKRMLCTSALYTPHGMLPNYTGHIPGHYNRYGVSYGKSSKVTAHQLAKKKPLVPIDD